MACAIIMHIFLNFQVFYWKKKKTDKGEKKKNENIMYPVQSWIVNEVNPHKICLTFSKFLLG